jgi:YD repeat-containing protein
VAICTVGFVHAATTTTYTYDALGRLTFVTDPVNGNRDYDYDKAGNRLLVAVAGANDAANEPPLPGGGGGGAPSVPQSLASTYQFDCNWLAQWQPPAVGTPTYYLFKETANAARNVPSGNTSTGVVCTSGNPSSNKPSWIEACNASGCSAPAYFP